MKFSNYAAVTLALIGVVMTPAFADPAPAKPADPKPVTPASAAAPAAPAAKAPTTATAAPAAAVTKQIAGYQVEMKSYRWRKHPRKNYERLVLEFARKDKGGGPIPTPNVVPSASGKEATIVVGGVSLMGDSAENKVSDTYGSKSAFLSPLSILVDANNGFSVKLSFKKSDVVAEAMWLEAPARLVIDVFASAGDRNAIRATAQDNADSDEKVAEAKPVVKDNRVVEATATREPVAEKKVFGTPNDAGTPIALPKPVAVAAITTTAPTETRSLFATPPAPVKKARRRNTARTAAPVTTYDAPAAEAPHIEISSRDEQFLCFPANAQVGLSVFFAPKNKRGDKDEVRLDIQNTNQKVQSASNIVCYPAAAQVEASISFREDKALTKTDESASRELTSKK